MGLGVSVDVDVDVDVTCDVVRCATGATRRIPPYCHSGTYAVSTVRSIANDDSDGDVCAGEA